MTIEEGPVLMSSRNESLN